MYVKLPKGRDYSGEEIVCAFKKAAAFKASPSQDKRWIAWETDREMQYEAGSVRETIRKMGVWVRPQKMTKRWGGLFGKMIWWDDVSDKNPGFMLKQLLYRERHVEIEVSVSMGCSGSFTKAEPRFREFLVRFFKELENPQAATISPIAP